MNRDFHRNFGEPNPAIIYPPLKNSYFESENNASGEEKTLFESEETKASDTKAILKYQDFIKEIIKPIYNHFRQEISNYRDLEENWDSFGSNAPSREAVENSLEVLEFLFRKNNLPELINPSPESITFEFFYPDEYVLIEFYNSGEIVLLKDIEGSNTIVHEIENDEYDIIARELNNITSYAR